MPNLALSQLKWKYLILKEDFIFGSEVGATYYKVVLCNIAQEEQRKKAASNEAKYPLLVNAIRANCNPLFMVGMRD